MGGIDPGRVVGAGMQDNDGPLRSCPEVLDHPWEVETPRILVPVAVLLHLVEPAVLEDHAVVAPEI